MYRTAFLTLWLLRTACGENTSSHLVAPDHVAARSSDAPPGGQPTHRPAIEIPARPVVLDPHPPPDLAEVVDPKPYIFRGVYLGAMSHPSRRTSILRRTGDRASLQRIIEADAHDGIAEARASEARGDTEAVVVPRRGRPTAWKITSVETFVGTVRRAGKYTRFDLVSAAKSLLQLVCRPTRIAIHHQRAELVSTPRIPGRYYSECSERGVWRPSATQNVEVLACADSERDLEEAMRTEGAFAAVFAPTPGVELLSVNDDCALQGGGYRQSLND